MRRARPPVGWEHVRNCFPVPNEVFQLNLSTNEIAIYAYLLRCADRRTGQCHPSMQTIAETLRLSRNTVAKHIHSLEEQGLIVTERTEIITKRGIKKNGNLLYTIIPMHEIIEQRYQRQVEEWERQQIQQKLARRRESPPCLPL